MKSINFTTPPFPIGVLISLIKNRNTETQWNADVKLCMRCYNFIQLHIKLHTASVRFSGVSPINSTTWVPTVNRKTTNETSKSLRNHGLAFILFHVFVKPYTLLDFFHPKYFRDGNRVFCFVYGWFSWWMRFVVDYEWLMKFRCRLLLSPLIQFLYMHLTCWPT